jgi:DnaJ family protein C protein 2
MSVPFLMRKRSSMRALTYNSADVPKGGWAVVASCAEPVKRVGQEPAGHSFHAAALNYLKEPSTEDDAEPLPEEEDVKLDDPAHVHPASWEGTKKKKGVKGGKDQHDHYQLLGLGHLRYLANEDQIKKAYRATSLKHHPDKQAAVLLDLENEEEKDAKREELDNHFKLIQEAYEVLTDPTKRRLFDSIDEFDDDIPDQCGPKDFYKVYGPVFQRNSRWSLQQPCPDLGDDKTPFAEVDKFYDFWFLFKSWREFPQEDEFELDQAEGREHKRWMERQNAKLREK